MAAVDKVHASVMLIHILKRHPTGDAAIEEIASPVGLHPGANRSGHHRVGA